MLHDTIYHPKAAIQLRSTPIRGGLVVHCFSFTARKAACFAFHYFKGRQNDLVGRAIRALVSASFVSEQNAEYMKNDWRDTHG